MDIDNLLERLMSLKYIVEKEKLNEYCRIH